MKMDAYDELLFLIEVIITFWDDAKRKQFIDDNGKKINEWVWQLWQKSRCKCVVRICIPEHA